MYSKSGFSTKNSGWFAGKASVLTLLLWAIPTFAYHFAGGTGEPYDPYQIATAEQLISIGDDPNLLDKHFVLINDIDLDPNLPGRKIFDRAVIGWEYGTTRGGERRIRVSGFSGTFNGNDHVIRNLTMECSFECGGLFRGTADCAEIMSLGLEDVRITSSFDDCEYLAPLVAWNSGKISSCYATGNVWGSGEVDILAAGLIGRNEGTVSYCYATGSVLGGDIVGGLIGENEGAVSYCYTTGSVSGRDIVGGLVGRNEGSIRFCYSLCHVSGSQWVAGLVGYHDARDEVDLWQCFSAGEIEGLSTCGALIGEADYESVPLNSYYLNGNDLLPDSEWGTPLIDTQMRESKSFRGWSFIDANHPDAPWIMPEYGYPQLFYQAGYRPIPDISDLPVSEAEARLNSVGYRIGTVTFDYHSRIDVNSIIVTLPQFYAQDANVDLVVCQGGYDWQDNVGDGSHANPYQIQSVGQLESLSDHPELYDRSFVLRNDLNFSGRIYSGPFVKDGFSGSFDGLGHALRNLTMISDHSNALFYGIDCKGIVRNLVLENIDFYGRNSDNSAIACFNYGTIVNCFVSGVLIGNHNGLLVVFNVGTIMRCGAEGGVVLIDDSYCAGGAMIAHNYNGYVVDSYAQVEYTVYGGSQLGGMIGEHEGEDTVLVSRCYAATYWDIESPNECEIGGLVGDQNNDEDGIGDCFYLIPDDEGIVLSNDIGTPLTENEMIDQNSFENWDFWGDEEDGNKETWFMPEDGYPRLTWQVEGYLSVPEVSLMELTLAQELIVDAGLELGQVSYDYGESTPEGTVIKTSPSGVVEIGTEIDVVVSLGSYSWQDNIGQGTAECPYEIASAGQLLSLSNHPELYGRHFDLVNDIDLDGYTFEKALIAAPNDLYDDEYSGTPFSGSFNGGLHKIQNLYISATADGYYGPCYLGLFGCIASEGRVILLSLEDVIVSGDHDSYYLGTLCARNQGIVQGCYASGTVSYRKYSEVVGGLVGENQGWVSQCASDTQLFRNEPYKDISSSTGPIRGRGVVDLALPVQCYGGLVGFNSGSISDCYAAGSVQGSEYTIYTEEDIGGLVGGNHYQLGSISNCYYLGWSYAQIDPLNEGIGYGITAGSVQHCYTLDPNEDADIVVPNVTCLSQQEMIQQESFVGWDFFGETANGTDDLWWMPEGDYPRLWWEAVE